MPRSARSLYEFGPYRLDPVNRRLLRGSTPVGLTPRAFDTLLALVQRPGQLVTKAELLDKVWGSAFVQEGTLSQNIYTLRRALSPEPQAPDYIETVPRAGYRFLASVRELPIAGVAEGPGEPPIRTLAVLPLLWLGRGEDEDFLGLAVADALITRLGGLDEITVRPTSTVLEYAGRRSDAMEAGRRLRADAVVEGSLQRDGSRLRVNLRLVRVRDGATPWAESFDAVFEDLFQAQDAISDRVVGALGFELTAPSEPPGPSRRGGSVEAHQAYVRGRYFWNLRTKAGLEKAVEEFRQAIERDPRFALAYAGLADSWALMPLYGDARPLDVFPRAIEAAERALELDRDLAEAHTSRAYAALFFEREMIKAEERFRRALKLRPGYPTAHHWYAFLLSAAGRHGEALPRMKAAQTLDPSSRVINSDLGLLLHFAGRHEEAVDQFGRTLELDSEFAYARFGLGLAYLELGLTERGVVECRDAVELSGGSTTMLAALGYACSVAGRPDEARKILRDFEERSASEYVQASRFALVHAGLGEMDACRSLARLRQALEERSRYVIFLGVWPAFARLRPEPGFRDILAAAGLPGPD